jgi:flavodoxin
MKTIIVYYSLTGNTEYVSNIIKDKLKTDILKLEPIKKYHDKGFTKFLFGGKSAVMKEEPSLKEYNFNGDKYDNVILALPVWASCITPPIRTFIKENRESLKDKSISIVICYSGGGADKVIDKTKEFLEIDSFKHELILIDPKDKPNEGNDKLIEEFCKNFK